MRVVCQCGATHPKGARCPHDTSRVHEVHASLEYRAARLIVFARDSYVCQFCDEACVNGDRFLKPTAAHWPLSIDQLVACGCDPSHPDTMVTAHLRCHGRVDGARSRQ